ncbi:MAG: phenylphosphate carboxylase subunit delta [Deltaproteobacteria bacterium]|nr:phenylphosphate carboxylase subunit delta [Deltaproteobacteria bacterium]
MNLRIAPIRLLILDVDGVLTDGRIVFDSNGVESKFFNVKDGHGIKMLQRAGITVGIISGRESQVATNRAAELGIELVYQKSLDKMIPYRDILAKTGYSDHQVAFMGDDIIDLPLLRRVGFSAAPADAVSDVLSHVHFVTKNRGGWGAVREVCDLILKEQSAWESITAKYFLL